MAKSSGYEAGRPQPTTTVEAPGGPFIRHSQPGRMPQYTVSTQPYGGIVTQPLVARPGYYKQFRIKISAKGGVNGSKTVAVKADAPESSIAQIVFKDAFGTPLFVGPGWEILRLVPMLSGGFGTLKNADTHNLPSYSAPSTGGSGTGNFIFSSALPLEFVKGYGVIAGANASLPPSLTMNLNSATAVYSTAPGTAPKLSVQVDGDFYWLPEGAGGTGYTLEPPGLGTTRQWLVQQANPQVSSTGTARIQFPRLGGYVTTIAIVARNKNGTRVDVWPGYATGSLSTGTKRIRIYVDGVPIYDTTTAEFLDDFAISYPTVTRPTGVFAISRRTALGQTVLGLMDTGEQFLSTNPGTLIEIEGSPWGKFSTGPATLNVVLGQVVPSGSLIQGLPEL